MRIEILDAVDDGPEAPGFDVPEDDFDDQGYVDDFTLNRIGLAMERELGEDR